MDFAKKRGEPMAQLVREYIQKGLEQEKVSDASGTMAIEQIVKIQASGGPSDLSENMDHYLYGRTKKKK